MIRIYQATSARIRTQFLSLKDEANRAIYLDNNSSFPTGWWGIKTLIHALKEYFDAGAIDKVIGQNKAISCFLFPELSDTLTDAEAKVYAFYKARLESRLNVPYGLLEAVAGLLDQLIGPYTFSLMIPDPVNIDPESLRVIENYYRLFPESRQKIVVGFPTDIVDREDVAGITWERSQGTVQYFVGNLFRYPATEVIDLDAAVPEAISSGEKPFWNADRPADKEELVWSSLTAGEMNIGKVLSAVRVMESCYERYSFRAVVKIGLRILETQFPLGNDIKAAIHGLVGSAANFYQFTHHGNPPFDDFLEYHFLEALRNERRPEIRSALLYRITFTLAERKADLDRAAEWAEKAVVEATQNTLPVIQHDYHLAWALNVRAHVYAHKDMTEACAEDAERAYALLEEGLARMEKEGATSLSYWANDYKLSIFNLAIHQVYTGDEINEPAYSRAWFKRMNHIMELMPRIMRFDTFHWIDYHRNKLALRDALSAAETGIEDAVFFKHGQLYVYLFCAADLNYRMGNAAKALQLFEQANQVRPLYNDLFHMFSFPWFIGNCYARMGLADDAEAVFEKELIDAASMDYQIRLMINLALLSAHKGDREALEHRMNKAIDMAVEYGEQNLLLKITATAGYTLCHIGDHAGSAGAYNQAMDLANSLHQEDLVLNPAYLFEMYTGYLMVHGYSEALFVQTIQLIPEALDDMESWWYLTALAPFVEIFRNSRPAGAAWTKVDEALSIFDLVIAERADYFLSAMPANRD